MTARIFKPAKNAMQSGRAKTREWQLDYEPEQPRSDRAADGLDVLDRHEATAHLAFRQQGRGGRLLRAQGHPLPGDRAKDSAQRSIAYADNFAFKRVEPWTH
jgi:hypothetical protein